MLIKLHPAPFKTVMTLLLLGAAIFLTACSSTVKESPPAFMPKPSEKVGFTQSDRAKIRQFTLFDKLKSKRHKAEYHYKTNDRLPRFYPRLPLPPLLERKLSPLPPTYTRIQIGDDYGIINVNSRVIYDIIYNVDANMDP